MSKKFTVTISITESQLETLIFLSVSTAYSIRINYQNKTGLFPNEPELPEITELMQIIDEIGEQLFGDYYHVKKSELINHTEKVLSRMIPPNPSHN
ncbi:MAG: hypothetical protein JNL32_04820 [Candidatus Kapabacteria bacterium]|nr:hypothetical protein [Candidatus Kapabacteria bacterium]